MAGLDELVTNSRLILTALGTIQQTLADTFPRITGSFTLNAASSTSVTEPSVSATSVIMLIPTNASAGTLQAGANAIYLSGRTAGTGFTVTTAGGGSAAGTEQFSFMLVNPS